MNHVDLMTVSTHRIVEYVPGVQVHPHSAELVAVLTPGECATSAPNPGDWIHAGASKKKALNPAP